MQAKPYPFDPGYVLGYLTEVLEEITGNADHEVQKLLTWLASECAVDSMVSEFVAGLQRAEEKRKQTLADLPAGTCGTCMGEGYLGSVESQRISDCPDCTGGVTNPGA